MEVEPSTWYSSRVTLPSPDPAHWRLTSQPCLCSNHHSTWAHKLGSIHQAMLKCHEIYWIIFRKRIRTTGVDGCCYCLRHIEAGLCIHALVDHLFNDELLPEPRLTICDMDHSKTIRRSLDENHFSPKKVHLKIPFAKCRLYPSLNML